MREALDALVGDAAWDRVTFEAGSCKWVIEVTFEGQRFTVNIPHQEREGLLPKITSVGIPLPPRWKVMLDRPGGLVLVGYLEIDVTLADAGEIPAFVERVGSELLGWKDSDRLFAILQN